MLATIALPSFINQVAKSRETDAKNFLGMIARSQQIYHFETRKFTNDINLLNIGGINNSEYYDFPNPSIANNNIVKHQAIAKDPATHLVKNYAIRIYHASGLYDIAICKSAKINEVVDIDNTLNGNCSNNGIKIK